VYICLCRVVTRKAIEATIQAGARTVEEVARRSGAGTECGKCRRNISKLIEINTQTRRPASLPLMHNSN
jgi:bacterioferritin-associated ferredoxin